MESVYNDIASHWCGHSYDLLCWDGYTSKEVKIKRCCFDHGFSSRRAMKLGGRRREEFHGCAFWLYSTKKTSFLVICCYSLFILVHLFIVFYKEALLRCWLVS